MRLNVLSYQNAVLKVVKIGLIITLFTPLILGPFGLTLSAYPKTVFFRSLVEIIFIFYLVLVFLNRRYFPKLSFLVLAVFFFVCVLLLTSITGINFFRSFFGDPERAGGVILYIHLLVFFLILISVFSKEREWFKLLKISVAVSGVSSFVAILQKFGFVQLYGISPTYRVSGTLSNPDFFAPYMVLTFFLAIFVFLIENKRSWKIAWLSILGLNFIALFLSGTRGAWIGMAAGIIFLFPFLIFYFLKLKEKKRKIILFGVLFLVILIFLAVLKPAQFGLEKSEFLARISNIYNFSLDSRGDVWKIAFESFKQRPILGWGPESFSFIFDKYFKAENIHHIREEIYFDNPHNKIMDILSANGILGFLAYLSIFLIIFYLLFKFKANLSLRIILAAFFISYFVQTLFCFDTISTYLIFFLVLGFVNNNFSNPLPEFSKRFNPLLKVGDKPLFALKILCAIFLAFFSLITLYQVNLKPTIAAAVFPFSVKYESVNPKKAISNYKESLQNTIYDKDFALIIVERGLHVLIKEIKDKKQEAGVVDIIYGLKPYLEKSLKKPDRRRNDTYEYLALISQKKYLLSQDPVYLREMEEVLKKALDFNNQRPEFYRLMGELRILENNYQEGEEYFKKVHQIYSANSFSYYTKFYREIGLIYLRAGNNPKAAENLKKALDIEYFYRKYSNQKAIVMSSEDLISFTEAVALIYYNDLDDFDTCRQIYERAIEIYPEYKNELKSHLEILIDIN